MPKCQCPKCDREYDLLPAMQGKRLKCSKCRTVFIASASSEPDLSQGLNLDDIWEAVHVPTNSPVATAPVITSKPKKTDMTVMKGCGFGCLSMVGVLVLIGFVSDMLRVPFPYQLVDTKRDAATGNVVELYAYSGPIDRGNLQEFFQSRADQTTAGNLHFVVLFDFPRNAKYPSQGMTGGYALEDADITKHIRADYLYVWKSGYSHLNYTGDGN